MTLQLDTLESWLWDSADILRGSVDSSDFKNYIFGLLFLKRASDVFDEEIETLTEEEGDGYEYEDAYEDVHFKIPKEAHWKYLIAKGENIGEALDKAFASIEEENAALKIDGVLTAVHFGNKEVLGDETLQRLLNHFNKYSLRNADLYKPDMLGDAYEYLIRMFADDAGKKGGEFYTPRGVVKLIVNLLKPEPGNKVYDPTCGSGGMLIESARYISKQEGGKTSGGQINCSLSGQEKNLGTWAICKLNMILHNYTDADIQKGDTLADPKHRDANDDFMLQDRVIANPPFSLNKWWNRIETNLAKKVDKNGKEKEVAPNYNKEVSDPYGRFQYGIPPRGYADLAFLQHMLTMLKTDGRMGVVLPHGVLFRGGAEGKIRQQLLENDLIEAVVGLPSALFYNTGIPASIIILNKQKQEHLKDKLIIIDGSEQYKEGKNQNALEKEHVDTISEWFDTFYLNQEADEENKYARLVELKEIAENDYNLNIARYIDTSEPEPEINVSEVLQDIQRIETEEAQIDSKLKGFLNELGY
ncbi:type I restriction-modification protein subunit M (plasmid) [Fulvitalea axinellae]|uniref:site-specific DNA-methyltransferase (adenine-specific) n=1 Tax=Fulvitalea axinellae TaxID=1182444 RepID=A0AAU9CYG8_9BACT|nr:type I restriction-modification protein subunit M [Fulvitalea axinellae]